AYLITWFCGIRSSFARLGIEFRPIPRAGRSAATISLDFDLIADAEDRRPRRQGNRTKPVPKAASTERVARPRPAADAHPASRLPGQVRPQPTQGASHQRLGPTR